MSRKYKPKAGRRSYRNYTDESLRNAVQEIQNQSLSMRQASKKYKIPLGTLSHKINAKHSKTLGGPKVLSDQEEEDLKTVLLTLSVWRAPLTLLEVRMLVKTMLDKHGKSYARFKDNMPGDDWVKFYPGILISPTGSHKIPSFPVPE